MRKIKVLLTFIKFAVAVKIAFYKNIISKMTGNTAFAEPDVTLPSLTTLVTALENTHAQALSGSFEAVAERNQAELKADEGFRKLARYVDRVADGDVTIILNSGFHPSGQPEPAHRAEFEVEAGENPGEIVCKRKAQTGAKAYIWQYCIGPLPVSGDKMWIFAGASTQCRYTIEDLESGTKCWFRVAGVTPVGLTPWVDPIMKVVP